MGWILQDMSQDYTFDPEILASLCRELFQPEVLISELNEEDFRLFLKSLPPEMASYLYKNIPAYKGLIDSMYFDKRFLSKEGKGLTTDIVVQSCISTIVQLLEDSKINYSGMILYFYKLSCRKKKFTKERITFQIWNTVCAINEPLWILILSQSLAGTKCTLNFLFPKDIIIKREITFDIWGFYYGEIFLEAVDGICSVSLINDNKICYSTNVIYTKKSKSLLKVNDFFLYQCDTHILGVGKIDSLGIDRKNSKVRYTVYCSHCFQFIHFGTFLADGSTFEIILPFISVPLEHSIDLVIYFEYEGSSSVCRATIQKKNTEKLNVINLIERNSEDSIQISTRLEYGKYYLFALSKDEFPLESIRKSLEKDNRDFPDIEIGKQRITTLDGFLEKEESKFFAQEKIGIRLNSIVISNSNELYSLFLEREENVQSMFVDVYEVKDRLIHLNRFYSPISEMLQVWSEKRIQIPNEESKIAIYLSSSTKFIKIKKPREISNFQIKDKYYIKYREDLELEILDYKYNIYKKYYKRHNLWLTFSEKLEYEGFHLYILNEIESRIMNLRSNHPEHLMILIYLYIKNYNNHLQLEYIVEKIDYLFRIYKLKNSKVDINLYGLAEEILSFKSQLFFKFPDLFSYIEEISKKYRKMNYRTFDNYIFENLYNYLQWKDSEIILIRNDVYYLEIIFILYKYLLEYDKDEVQILFEKKDRLDFEYSSGIKGFLQKIGLFPVSEKKRIHIKLKKVRDAKKKLKELFVFSLNQAERVNFRLYLLLEYLERNKLKDKSISLKTMDSLLGEKESTGEQPIRINKMSFQIQDRGYLYFKEPVTDFLSIQIQLPSFLKFLSSNAFQIRENSLQITPPILPHIPLEFLCLEKGKGSIHFIITYQTGEYDYELGIVEVLE